jgi:hypothetical protein
VLYLLLGDIVGLPYTIWRQRSRGSLTYAEAAAIILDARKKAVDDLRAGRAAPYYLAPWIEPNPSSSATLPSSANGGDAAKGDQNR